MGLCGFAAAIVSGAPVARAIALRRLSVAEQRSPTFFALRICRTSNPALNFPPAQIHRAELRSRPDSLFSVGLQNRSQVSIPLARTQTPVLLYSLRRMFTNTASLSSPSFLLLALSLKPPNKNRFRLCTTQHPHSRNMTLFNLSAKDPPPHGAMLRLHTSTNSPQSPRSSFDRISSFELLRKSLRDHANAAMPFKIVCFWSKTPFSRFVLRCFYFLSFLPKKCVFGAKNALFRSLFCVCCVLQKTAPKCAVFVFLCLFVFVCDDLFNKSLQRKHR